MDCYTVGFDQADSTMLILQGKFCEGKGSKKTNCVFYGLLPYGGGESARVVKKNHTAFL